MPVLFDYHPREFAIEDTLEMNYHDLTLQEEQGDFAIWPLLRWGPFESNNQVESFPSPPSTVNIWAQTIVVGMSLPACFMDLNTALLTLFSFASFPLS